MNMVFVQLTVANTEADNVIQSTTIVATDVNQTTEMVQTTAEMVQTTAEMVQTTAEMVQTTVETVQLTAEVAEEADNDRHEKKQHMNALETCMYDANQYNRFVYSLYCNAELSNLLYHCFILYSIN